MEQFTLDNCLRRGAASAFDEVISLIDHLKEYCLSDSAILSCVRKEVVLRRERELNHVVK